MESNILRCSLDRNKGNVTKSPFKSTVTIGMSVANAVASISATQTYFGSPFNILNLGRFVREQITDSVNSEPSYPLKITSDLD